MSALASAQPRRRFSLGPLASRWLRTSWIPVALLVLVLLGIMVAMYFRLTEPIAALVAMAA